MIEEKGKKKRRTASVAGHACCADVIVLFEPGFLDALLGHDVAGCEEDLCSSGTVS